MFLESIFNLPAFSKHIFTKHRILGWKLLSLLFFPSTFKVSFDCLLPYIVSTKDEKILIFFQFVTSFFPLAALKNFFFFFLFQRFASDVTKCFSCFSPILSELQAPCFIFTSGIKVMCLTIEDLLYSRKTSKILTRTSSSSSSSSS